VRSSVSKPAFAMISMKRRVCEEGDEGAHASYGACMGGENASYEKNCDAVTGQGVS
jgi:hypothetical protein